MASFTLTTTPAQDARIVAAFGRRLGLPGDATGAQVKQQIIQFLKNAVQEQEQAVATESARAAVTEIDVS